VNGAGLVWDAFRIPFRVWPDCGPKHMADFTRTHLQGQAGGCGNAGTTQTPLRPDWSLIRD
jgi:hypothetical protein